MQQASNTGWWGLVTGPKQAVEFYRVIHKPTFGVLWPGLVLGELQGGKMAEATPIVDKFQLVPGQSPWWQHLCDNTLKKGKKTALEERTGNK